MTRKPITFVSVKFYCQITLICQIILNSHIAQLLLIHKFYCLRPGPHICDIMRDIITGEVSLENGRSISRNVAWLNILLRDVMTLLYHYKKTTIFFPIPKEFAVFSHASTLL